MRFLKVAFCLVALCMMMARTSLCFIIVALPEKSRISFQNRPDVGGASSSTVMTQQRHSGIIVAESSSSTSMITEATPPRQLPPVLSDIIAMLPPPFSDITPGTIAAKLRGNKPTNPFIKAVAEFIWVPIVFYPFVRFMAAFWWPIHLRLQQKFGAMAAFFLLSSNFALTAFPVALLLAFPMLTPTAPENVPIAREHGKAMRTLFWTWQYASIFLIGAYLPVPMLMATTPAAVWKTTTLPPLDFWSVSLQGLFFATCLEVTYYYKHRLYHWSTCKNPIVQWLNKIHKVHHSGDTRNMHPFDSSRMDMVELFTTVVAIMLGPMLWRGGVHPLLGISFFSYSIVNAFLAHTGYFTHDGGSHVLHHQRSNCNYGLMGLLDYLHGTSRARSVDLLYKVARMQRQMQKKLTRNEIDQITSDVSTSTKSRMYQPNEVVVHIGDPAESFFILEEGSCNAIIPNLEDGTDCVVKTYNEPGQYFGELALLRDQPRAATIRAGPAGCKLAEIPSKEFSMLSNLATTFEEQAASYDRKELPSYFTTDDTTINNAEAIKYSTLMPQEEYEPGQVIIKQGDPGDKMYILEEGTCTALIDGKEVRSYEESGDYFGELALLNNEPRKATVIAGEIGTTVAVVSRSVFDKIVTFSGDAMRQRASEMY